MHSKIITHCAPLRKVRLRAQSPLRACASLLVISLMLASPQPAGAQWQPLTHQPNFNASTMLLLTDGSVMCQTENSRNWHRLTPDNFGSYVNGTWSTMASGPNSPLYYASAVLADGRVFTAGGEYNAGQRADLLAAQIYDPEADTWTTIGTPLGWTNIGDAPCAVLANGTVLLGSKADSRTAVYDPSANRWTASGAKENKSSDEETWTLLPDGTVLTADCLGAPFAQRYIFPIGWIDAGSTPVPLVEAASHEIGPAVLLPNGQVFAIGATGHTAFYIPPSNVAFPGSWTSGPNLPTDLPMDPQAYQLGAKDAPACLLPSGNVLCAVGPVDGINANYLGPTFFFEFTGSTFNKVISPSNAGGVPYEGRMLLLPTGQVLFANGANDVEVYTPAGNPDDAWRPQITSCPTMLAPGNSTYTLQGRQLNGLSQAVSYGDDVSCATNYPLVQLRNRSTSHVFYCRTSGHSTMAVATGSQIVSTTFKVPLNAELGLADLTVIANGIPSAAYTVQIGSTVKGKLILEGVAASAAPQPVTFTFRTPGFDDYSTTLTVAPAGNFMVSLPKRIGILHIKGGKYLAVNITVDATSDVSGLRATLLAADANNDNSCDSTDFGILIGAYNSNGGIPFSGYDANADFNGDGSVDATDFGLLIGNFNTSGAD